MKEILRVRCPKCETAIVHQIKEETSDNKFTVTYYCGGCKSDFKKDYALGSYNYGNYNYGNYNYGNYNS